ncbi:MAG: protease modulator HflC [Pseudomonadota bacterium]
MKLKAFLSTGLGGLALVLGVVFLLFTFRVKEGEIALKLRLGEIIATDYDPGLHWRIPLYHNVERFNSRLRILDFNPERFLTIEKKDVIVDSFAKWRVKDASQYYRATGFDVAKTARLLSERISTRLRDEFGRRKIQEVISGERGDVLDVKEAARLVEDLGIELIDVRVKQIDLPAEVSDSVYERMRAERGRAARDLRGRGAEAAERIRAEADRERVVTLAEGTRQAETLRGEGDAKAAEIYATAFKQNPEFYSFYRSMKAYNTTFSGSNGVLVLDPSSHFFRYLKSPVSQ